MKAESDFSDQKSYDKYFRSKIAEVAADGLKNNKDIDWFKEVENQFPDFSSKKYRSRATAKAQAKVWGEKLLKGEPFDKRGVSPIGHDNMIIFIKIIKQKIFDQGYQLVESEIRDQFLQYTKDLNCPKYNLLSQKKKLIYSHSWFQRLLCRHFNGFRSSPVCDVSAKFLHQDYNIESMLVNDNTKIDCTINNNGESYSLLEEHDDDNFQREIEALSPVPFINKRTKRKLPDCADIVECANTIEELIRNERKLQNSDIQLRFEMVNNLSKRHCIYSVYTTKAEYLHHLNDIISTNGLSNYQTAIENYDQAMERFNNNHDISQPPIEPNFDNYTSQDIDSDLFKQLKTVVKREGYYGVSVPGDHLCLFHCAFVWLLMTGKSSFKSAVDVRKAVALKMKDDGAMRILSCISDERSTVSKSILRLFIEQEDLINSTKLGEKWNDISGAKPSLNDEKKMMAMYNKYCKLLEGDSVHTINYANLNEVTFYFLCDVMNANLTVHSTRSLTTVTFGPIESNMSFDKTVDICFTYDHFDLILDFLNITDTPRTLTDE
jgi:hypothetical protein